MEKIWFVALLCAIQIFAFVSTVEGQEKKEPMFSGGIKIATASGKLGRKKRESTEKLNFTEVDLSKYESGFIFADFKVSAGGCDAALVAAPLPTEDRRQLLEFTRAGSGGTKTTELFVMTYGKVFLLSKKVNKFYISGALIPIGMAAWYSKDCSGSYEINVFIKNAKPTCQMAPLKRSAIKRDVLIEKPDVYIAHIKVRPDGLEIMLTDKGLAKAQDGGSMELAQNSISAGERSLKACFGIDVVKLSKEINKHAVYHRLLPVETIRKRANPINVTWEELEPGTREW